jgi:hypothetical protein
MVDVEHCPIAMPELNEQLAAVRERARANSDTFKNGATLLMRAAKNGVLTRNDEIAVEDVDGIRFEFQAGDFFQNNPFILPKFVRHAIDEAKATGAKHLVDAYCGSGLFAISAARDFEQVIGVEISESAVKKPRTTPRSMRSRTAASSPPMRSMSSKTCRMPGRTPSCSSTRRVPVAAPSSFAAALCLRPERRRLCLLQSRHADARPRLCSPRLATSSAPSSPSTSSRRPSISNAS